MNFWNFILPAFIFMAPAAAGVYFVVKKNLRPESEAKIGMAVFSVILLVCVWGVIRFDNPVRTEFLWPFSADSSGYFGFSFQLHWTRFVWIFFSSSLLLALAALDGMGNERQDSKSLKFIFLLGSSFFSSLAFLSENILLSFLFIEATIFLLHAFSVQEGMGDEKAERASYFKRSCFVFLGLMALLGLAILGGLNVFAIMLLGAVFYIMAFIFSRHNFPDWSHLPLSLLHAGAVFFLLGRIIREDMPTELWTPLSTIFGVSTAIFSWLSLVCLSSLGSSFWLTFSFMSYLLFLRFSSGRQDDYFWSVYEAIAFGAIFAISCFFRFGKQIDTKWKEVVAFGISGLLLGIISGAIPGVDIAGARVTSESSIKLIGLGALTFLLSMVVAKSLVTSFSPIQEKQGDGKSFLLWLLPAGGVLLAQIAAVIRMVDVYGESPYRMGIGYLLSNLHILTAGSAVILGLFAGLLLGLNSKFIQWIRSKEVKMEDLFPGVDPIVIQWNDQVLRIPERSMEWITRKVAVLFTRGASLLQDSDRLLFSDKLYRNFHEYSFSLSLFTRYFHSGNTRAYLFFGVLITILGSLLFLWEGR